MTSKETSRNLDSSWTITSVFDNNTGYTFIPTTPPDAEEYGALVESPGILQPNSTGQNSGEWRAHSGTWTGITAISAYTWVDNSSIMVLLVEMPYSGPNNNTKVSNHIIVVLHIHISNHLCYVVGSNRVLRHFGE